MLETKNKEANMTMAVANIRGRKQEFWILNSKCKIRKQVMVEMKIVSDPLFCVLSSRDFTFRSVIFLDLWFPSRIDWQQSHASFVVGTSARKFDARIRKRGLQFTFEARKQSLHLDDLYDLWWPVDLCKPIDSISVVEQTLRDVRGKRSDACHDVREK